MRDVGFANEGLGSALETSWWSCKDLKNISYTDCWEGFYMDYQKEHSPPHPTNCQFVKSAGLELLPGKSGAFLPTGPLSTVFSLPYLPTKTLLNAL